MTLVTHDRHRVYAVTATRQRVPMTDAVDMDTAQREWALLDSLLHPEYHEIPRRWHAPQEVFLDHPDQLVRVDYFAVRSTDDPAWPAAAPTYRRTI
jgi:hypothetical protein